MKKLKLNILFWTVLCSLFLNVTLFPQVAHANDNRVVIFTSSDALVKEYMEKRLKEKFPQYEFVIEYLNTGAHAAKLKAEGVNTACDITFELDFDYLKLNENILAKLPYDFSVFTDDVVPASSKYICNYRCGGAIIINNEVLKEKGLAVPTTYAELLKPEYKNLISMPNPKTSGNAYAFLKSLINAWGEEEAFEYFEKLSENVLQFTTSGSGPVNALIQGEVAIGFGMTAQAVTEINKGANLQIIALDVGAPYSLYGFGVIKGKENRKSVKEVADFLYHEFLNEIAEKFYPERLYKDKLYTIPNYPSDIKYADMTNGGLPEKQRLLDKWEY